jgi:hypothetical protein
MENKVVPIRALLGELYLAAQMPNEALAEFEASQKTITYFARALGAARAGDLVAARAEIGHLDEIEARLIGAKDEYWARRGSRRKRRPRG